MGKLIDLVGPNPAQYSVDQIKEKINELPGVTDKDRKQILREYGTITGVGLDKSDYAQLEKEKKETQKE